MNNSILIVDDMMLNIDMLTDILGEQYTVMAAISGEFAIKLMNRKIPDLVLLDISMPGIDGFDVLRYMKSHEKLSNIPVIFVTGEQDSHAEEEGLSLGAVDYIKKPYNTIIVNFKVRNHLMMKNYRDNLELLVQERTNQLIERTNQLAASNEAIIMGMSLMSENHDDITGSHIERIKSYTRILANKMVELYPDIITAELARQIILFSPLHDVGKISISDVILKKAGILTPDEFELMKTHTIKGVEILGKTEAFLTSSSETDSLRVAKEIAGFHHEKYNGTGYPYGLMEDEIPLPARIVSITDVYDALRSVRPYKRAFTHAEAMDMILNGNNQTSPDHFDPKVLNAFSAVNAEFEMFSQL